MLLDIFYSVVNFIYQQPLTLVIGIWIIVEIVILVRWKKVGQVWWFIKRFFWLGVLLFVMNGLIPLGIQLIIVSCIAIYAIVMAVGD